MGGGQALWQGLGEMREGKNDVKAAMSERMVGG